MRLIIILLTCLPLILAYSRPVKQYKFDHKLWKYNQKLQDNPYPGCEAIPPALYCSHPDISKLCGYADFCQRYVNGTKDKPLRLTVFIESLCPDCQNFIVDQLYPKIYKNFAEYIHIELVPYGNAKIIDGKIQCQHGVDECEINKFQSCLIDTVKTQDQYVPLIYCIENELVKQTPFTEATTRCFETQKVEAEVQHLIKSCVDTELGTRLQMSAAARTENVWPEKHNHVPWIMINNVSLNVAHLLQESLPEQLCQWNTGHQIAYCMDQKKRLLTTNMLNKV